MEDTQTEIQVTTTPSEAHDRVTFWVTVNGRLVCAYGEYALRCGPEQATVSDQWLLAALGRGAVSA